MANPAASTNHGCHTLALTLRSQARIVPGTSLLSPPKRGSPQVTTEPSGLWAAKAAEEPQICWTFLLGAWGVLGRRAPPRWTPRRIRRVTAHPRGSVRPEDRKGAKTCQNIGVRPFSNFSQEMSRKMEALYTW